MLTLFVSVATGFLPAIIIFFNRLYISLLSGGRTRLSSELNSNALGKSEVLGGSADFNLILQPGVYKVQYGYLFSEESHGPGNTYGFGLLLVFKGGFLDVENRTLQLYFPHNSNTNSERQKIAWRFYNDDLFTDWLYLSGQTQ